MVVKLLKDKNKSKNKKRNTFRKVVRVFARIAVFAIVIAIILSIVFLSGVFSVKSIDVTIDGVNQDGESLQISEIESLSGLAIGQNLFEVARGRIKESILKNPYVDSVDVKKHLNGTVTIDVEEREIKYLINYAGSYIYIDNKGNILELSSEKKEVPLILGASTDFTSLAVGSSENRVTRLNDEDLEKLDVVNNIMEISKSNDVDALISGIDITNDKNYIVYLDSEGKTVYLGDCSNLNTRILYMKSIIKQESGKQGEIFLNVDLESEYPYFRESV